MTNLIFKNSNHGTIEVIYGVNCTVEELYADLFNGDTENDDWFSVDMVTDGMITATFFNDGTRMA